MQKLDQRGNFRDLVSHVKQIGSLKCLSQFFFIAWGFWGKRNERVYENDELDPKYVIERALYV